MQLDALSMLDQPLRLELGPYFGYRGEQHPLTVMLDAFALARLMQDARRGHRLYEWMKIQRPGDVLHYLRIEVVDAHQELWSRVQHAFEPSWHGPRHLAPIPFTVFDGWFHYGFGGDDTEPLDACWLNHRQSTGFWDVLMSQLLDWVQAKQRELRHDNDFLVQHELHLIDQSRHRRDFFASVARRPHVRKGIDEHSCAPEALRDCVLKLVMRDDVESVACPFTDFIFWRALVEKQLRRASKSGAPPQVALRLSGPDSGLPFDIEDWGGYVHIPYEGAARSHVFIEPDWYFLYDFRTGIPDLEVRFLLTRNTAHGRPQATRIEIGDGWFLFCAPGFEFDTANS